MLKIFCRILCTLLNAISLPRLPRKPFSLHQFARDKSVWLPVAYIANNLFTLGALSLSTSIPRVLGLLRYPTGAQPGHTPFLIFCRKPLFTFSRKLSTKYFDCPKAIFNINKPCGVGSNQKVGNLRDLIKPRSTKWIIFPPSTELRANLSGCQEIIPSALPDSRNATLSPNLIGLGSFAVLVSTKV